MYIFHSLDNIVHVLTHKHFYQIPPQSEYKVFFFLEQTHSNETSYGFLCSYYRVNANYICFFLSIGLQINTQYRSPFKVTCWIRLSFNLQYSLVVFFQSMQNSNTGSGLKMKNLQLSFRFTEL